MSNSNGALTRDQFLGFDSEEIRKVDLPGGKHVYVRTITAGERDRYDLMVIRAKTENVAQVSIRASVIIMSTCDKTGKRIFEAGDVDRINGMSTAFTEPIFDAALTVSSLREEDQKALAGN